MASTEIHSMKKFNPKVYQGKDRVYPPVPGAPNVRKILIWDEDKKEYKPPARGKIYLARRYEIDIRGKKFRKSEYFESLESARNWQSFISVEGGEVQSFESSVKKSDAPTFQEIFLEWKKRKFSSLRKSSWVAYENLVNRHLQMFRDYPINIISPKDIDAWLADRKLNLVNSTQAKTRNSFKNELVVLSIILEYYAEYYEEDVTFRFPIKKRHWKDAKLNISRPPRQKDLTETEFHLFLSQLVTLTDGRVLSDLATCQYYQALRISEIAALDWSNVVFDWSNPKESRLRISQHAVYTVEKGAMPKVEPGFKNSDSCGGIKELPMFPPTFNVLKRLHGDGGKSGLVFPNSTGNFFRYHTVYDRYNKAFEKAGLPYKATHVLRHGWCRQIFDSTNGDYGIAGQLLGNTSRNSIETYAQRKKSALATVAHDRWNVV
jgi:integrase